MRHRSAGDAAGFGQRLAHAVARAAAEIERLVPAIAAGSPQPVDGAQVRVGEVIHMHEVADARAVGRRIVRAEQRHARAEPERGIDGKRHQMRLGMVRFADRAAGIGAGGIEEAQRRRP